MSRRPLNIVVLGGSFAGLSVAHHFLDHIVDELSTFEDAPTYRVILISPSTHLFWNICAPRALVSPNLIDLNHAFVPLEPAFSRHSLDKFRFVQGWATAIDTSARRITVETVKRESAKRHSENSNTTNEGDTKIRTISYHALVIATGSSARSPLYSLHGTHEETLAEIRAFHARLQTANSIFIVGGGPSGVETAGQLAVHFNRKSNWPKPLSRYSSERSANSNGTNRPHRLPFRRHPSIRNESGAPTSLPPVTHVTPPAPTSRGPKTIALISGGSRLLPRLSRKAGKKAERQLRGLGVHVVHNLRQLSSTVNADGSSNCILNNDMTITSDLLIHATGVYPNTQFLPANMLDEAGYVVTDRETLRLHGQGIGDRVYAVGDCAAYSKNYILDVYEPIPCLMKNLHNDLLAHEYRLQTMSSLPSPPARHRIVRTPSAADSLLSPPEADASKHSSYRSEQSDRYRRPPSPLAMRPVLSFPSPPRKAAILLGNPQATSNHFPRRALLTSEEARRKIEALEDAHYYQNQTDTQLMPITRFGGVGVAFGWRVPSFMVWMIKGRDYAMGRAKDSAEKGANPFAVK